MPEYTATTLTSEGARARRRVSGRDTAEARDRLQAGGFFVERIAPATRARPFPARMRLSAVHRIEFYRQMETLLSSGVLIADALNRLKDRYPDARMRRVLLEVHAQVSESRRPLSQALGLFPRSFPPGIVTLIEAGEEGGAALLAERFGDLAERTAYEAGIRRQVVEACAYPIFVFAMASALYAFLLAVVFPRLGDLLGSLGGQMPPLTRQVMGASRWAQHSLPALAVLAAGLACLVPTVRKVAPSLLLFDRAFLGLPLAGAIYRDLSVGLICRVFASLYRANKPAPEIVELCSKMVGNRAVRRELLGIRSSMVNGGASVAEAFGRSRLFPPLACLAIDAGERAGKLPQSMDRVAVFLSARARSSLAGAIAILNPVMTLVIVGGVGAVMISFFQAVYQIVYAAH